MTFGISAGTYLMAGAALGGGLLASKGQQSAAETQADAANQSAKIQKQIADQQIALQREQYNKNLELQQPWLEAGRGALNKLTAASDYKPFSMDQFQADPGYAFRLSEGQKALDRSAAARGGMISGGALKAATRYGQDMGSQEYMNAFNRYGVERERMLGPLQSLAGVGQSATGAAANAGQNYASGASAALGNYGAGASNALMTAGNANAAGQLGIGNTINNALGTFASSYQNQNNFNQWLASQNKTA